MSVVVTGHFGSHTASGSSRVTHGVRVTSGQTQRKGVCVCSCDGSSRVKHGGRVSVVVTGQLGSNTEEGCLCM